MGVWVRAVLSSILGIVKRSRYAIPVFGRKIVRRGDRYCVFLPRAMNELWEELSKSGKVDIIIMLKDDYEEDGD